MARPAMPLGDACDRRPRGSTPRVSPWRANAAGDKPYSTEVQLELRTPGGVEMKAGLSKVNVLVTEGQTKLRDGATIVAVAGARDKG